MGSPTQTHFGTRLRRELDQQRISVRKLARTMAPHNPEQMRRNLARWIGGYNQPSRLHLIAVAEALGIPVEELSGDDDEESDPVSDLMGALRRFVRDELKTTEPTASLAKATVGSEPEGV